VNKDEYIMRFLLTTQVSLLGWFDIEGQAVGANDEPTPVRGARPADAAARLMQPFMFANYGRDCFDVDETHLVSASGCGGRFCRCQL